MGYELARAAGAVTRPAVRSRVTAPTGERPYQVIRTGGIYSQFLRAPAAAWLLLHPAMIEGWGIVVAEAAVRGTPAIGFRVPGLRDSVIDGQTGRLVATESEFASAWASLSIDGHRRHALGRAASERALLLHWSAAVDGFAKVADEAVARAC